MRKVSFSIEIIQSLINSKLGNKPIKIGSTLYHSGKKNRVMEQASDDMLSLPQRLFSFQIGINSMRSTL
jgi:hypothetical protein